MERDLVTKVFKTTAQPVFVPDCWFDGADKWSQRQLTML